MWVILTRNIVVCLLLSSQCPTEAASTFCLEGALGCRWLSPSLAGLATTGAPSQIPLSTHYVSEPESSVTCRRTILNFTSFQSSNSRSKASQLLPLTAGTTTTLEGKLI